MRYINYTDNLYGVDRKKSNRSYETKRIGQSKYKIMPDIASQQHKNKNQRTNKPENNPERLCSWKDALDSIKGAKYSMNLSNGVFYVEFF